MRVFKFGACPFPSCFKLLALVPTNLSSSLIMVDLFLVDMVKFRFTHTHVTMAAGDSGSRALGLGLGCRDNSNTLLAPADSRSVTKRIRTRRTEMNSTPYFNDDPRTYHWHLIYHFSSTCLISLCASGRLKTPPGLRLVLTPSSWARHCSI